MESLSSWEASIEACNRGSNDSALPNRLKKPFAVRKFHEFYAERSTGSDIAFILPRMEIQKDNEEKSSTGTVDLTPKHINNAFIHDESIKAHETSTRLKETFFPRREASRSRQASKVIPRFALVVDSLQTFLPARTLYTLVKQVRGVNTVPQGISFT